MRAAERGPNDGMTLAELLAVIIILGVLVSIAIPTMGKNVQRGYWEDAQHLLQAIHDGEQRYFDKETLYRDTLGPCAPGDLVCLAQWRAIFMDDPNFGTIPVTFTVDASSCASPPCFTATATNQTTSGQILTIDENGTLDTTNWPKP